jgi:uncharacterized tellurite resistance protein B-like protein
MSTFTELQTSAAFRDTYGVSGMPGPLFMAVARGLKVVLGADGRIHPAELNAYLETCRRYGASDEMLRELQEFDCGDTTLEQCFAGIDPDSIPARALLYDVVRIAKADADYARGESIAVRHAADLLGIDDEWLGKITALVDAEDALRELRLRLLAPSQRKVRVD